MEQKNDHGSRHQRNNGHNFKGHQKSLSTNGLAFGVRKAEKLTTALYIVTDIISDKDPFKWELRDAGIIVFSAITMSNSFDINERISHLRCLVKKIDRVISFLDIGQSSHVLSDMNSSVLKKEYISLKDIIAFETDRLKDRRENIFPEMFFDVSKEEKSLESDLIKGNEATDTQKENLLVSRTESPRVSKGQAVIHPERMRPLAGQNTTQEVRISKEKDVLVVNGIKTPSIISAVGEEKEYGKAKEQNIINGRNDLSLEKKNLVDEPRSFPSPNSDFIREITHSDRRKIILALIRQKPALTVKDIIKSISGVSEKTIQRELLSMVEDGLLVKKGERRWSVYSLSD